MGLQPDAPLERLSTRRKKRRNALAMKFGAITPRNAHQKAIKARLGHGLPYRPEATRVSYNVVKSMKSKHHHW